jgi:hypothetical protein
MNSKPVIDLSLRHPQLIIADKGIARGAALVLWFRLLRPACVGSMWAGITIYAYRYLLPFNQGDLSWAELVSYCSAIATMASVLMMWMVLARVAHPFTSKSRTQRLLRRKAGLTVEPGPFTTASSRELNSVARVFVASHDSNGLIAALKVLSVTSPSSAKASRAKAAEAGYGPRRAYSSLGAVPRRVTRH